MKYAFTEIKQTKRGRDANDAQHRGDPQHKPHVPRFWLVLIVNVVIGDRQDGSVIE